MASLTQQPWLRRWRIDRQHEGFSGQVDQASDFPDEAMGSNADSAVPSIAIARAIRVKLDQVAKLNSWGPSPRGATSLADSPNSGLLLAAIEQIPSLGAA
jgi:hypothetical protein